MDERNDLGETTGEELLHTPDLATEILPDEEAMAAAGLKTPADAAVDRLLAEAKEQSGMD